MTVIAATVANGSTITSTSWPWSLPCPAMHFSRRGSTQEAIESNIDTITGTTVATIEIETTAATTGAEVSESTIVTTRVAATVFRAIGGATNVTLGGILTTTVTIDAIVMTADARIDTTSAAIATNQGSQV